MFFDDCVKTRCLISTAASIKMSFQSNTIITLGIGVAAGLAIYYMWNELQSEKRKTDAMARHMRKLEGLIWAYNIQPRRQHHSSMEEDDDDSYSQSHSHSDEESSDEDELQLQQQDHPEQQHNHHESDPLDTLIRDMAGGVQLAGGAINTRVHIMGQRRAATPHPRRFVQVEEITSDGGVTEGEDDDIPAVESFNSTKPIANNPYTLDEDESEQSVQADHLNDEEPSDHYDQSEELDGEDLEAISPEEDVRDSESKEISNEVSDEYDSEDDEDVAKNSEGQRVYVDNYHNRKLGRVGQPY